MCETKHSNHWCYKTCQSFSNSFFLCRDLIFFYSTAQHAICFSTTIEVVLTDNKEFKQPIYTVMVALEKFLFPCINRVTICHWNVIILINIQLHIPEIKPRVVSSGLLPSLLIHWEWLYVPFFPFAVLPKLISIPKWTQWVKIGKRHYFVSF